MRTHRIALDDVGGLGIFNLMAKALMVLPWEQERFERTTAPGKVPAPRLGLLDRFDRWCWRLSQRAVEDYLAQARDVHDLEARIRDLERRPPYRCF
jgi:hypothetical protein